jgi:enoyl-CoA hydratase/carnithine racemase
MLASIRSADMTDTDTVLVERDGPVTIVSINRPHCRNAVDGATARKLFDAFRAFDADAEASVAVFTGTGCTSSILLRASRHSAHVKRYQIRCFLRRSPSRYHRLDELQKCRSCPRTRVGHVSGLATEGGCTSLVGHPVEQHVVVPVYQGSHGLPDLLGFRR